MFSSRTAKYNLLFLQTGNSIAFICFCVGLTLQVPIDVAKDIHFIHKHFISQETFKESLLIGLY
jgi:hypothetical protein